MIIINRLIAIHSIVSSRQSFPGRLVQSPEPNRRQIARAYTNCIVIRLSTIQNDQEHLFSGWGDCSNDLDLYLIDSMNRSKLANLAGIHNTYQESEQPNLQYITIK
jgi:hypothetical protein